MSRDIKFRAWNKKLKKMCGVFTLLEAMQNTEEYLLLTDDVYMQYTGLKDKNGKEIYEGDVVYVAGYGDYNVEFPFVELYEAIFEGDIGGIKGNIYENPELQDV